MSEWFRVHRRTLYAGLLLMAALGMVFGAATAAHALEGGVFAVPYYAIGAIIGLGGVFYLRKQPRTTKEES